jgi:pimeloyl-ACP methyl ester carboxylesterase
MLMSEVELSAGVLEYDDTRGDLPVVVLLNGLFIGRSVWRSVVADLRSDHRCLPLELPLGAHRRAMRDGADLSGRGLAGLVAEFLDHLDLWDVTLVGCDWGGAQLLVKYGMDERVGRLVLLPQESFDNFPPGLPAKTAWLSSKVPGALAVALQQMRIRPIRRLPLNFGLMSKRPVPNTVMDAWLQSAMGSSRIRRDVLTYLRATRKGEYVEAAEKLRGFDRPALVIWATEDRLMKPGYGKRLAQCLPDGRLVEVADSYTLIPEDQPERCAQLIRTFIEETATTGR